MTICKAAAPYELGKHCDLPSTEWTAIGVTIQCPSCKTWYLNKQFGTFGGLWVLLPKNPTYLKSTPLEPGSLAVNTTGAPIEVSKP